MDRSPETSVNICLDKGLVTKTIFEISDGIKHLNKMLHVESLFMQNLNSLYQSKRVKEERSTVCCELSLDFIFRDASGKEMPKVVKLFLIDTCSMDAMRSGFCLHEISYAKRIQASMMEGLRLRLKNESADGHIKDEILWRARKCFQKYHNLDFICNIMSITDQQMRDAFECLQVKC